jgi:hypothetical protein
MNDNTWHIAYWAKGGKQGVAVIISDVRPSWAVCHKNIPGFVTGRLLQGPKESESK